MNQSRQRAFQQLRSPCVELSSVALKFKANQASAKAVLLALEPVHDTLKSLGDENLLDEKLAEYAFFPLTHIFNQSQRLSSRSLELAVKSVQILVSKGWRERLAPEMAKQLLILMGLLVSSKPKQQVEATTEELKIASFECIAALMSESASASSDFLSGGGAKNIGDQLVYQLLEAVAVATSDHVQVSAAHALLELQRAIKNPVLLASLLPRTVSILVKVLRPSTQARRTAKVLATYLQLLTEVLRNVLADELISQQVASTHGTKSSSAKGLEAEVVLDQSWLNATTPQIDLALVQVVKLKTAQTPEVGEALLQLCLMVINDCSRTLASSLPLMVDTMAVLSYSSYASQASAALKHLIASRTDLAEILSAKFYDWSQALPRVMQGNDDKPKQQLLKQVATSFIVLTDTLNASDEAATRIASVLVDTVAAAIGSSSHKTNMIREDTQIPPNEIIQRSEVASQEFLPVVLGHQSQSSSTEELKHLIVTLKSQSSSQITRSLVDHLHDHDINRKLSAAWLALQFLSTETDQTFELMDLIEGDASASDVLTSPPFLISDFYTTTLTFLTEYSEVSGVDVDWRLVALSLEGLVLQASQLGSSYRPELMETLFPLLTLLSSNNPQLQQHAMTALNLLATGCQYGSAAQMLIENVDYLINAVALRLNAFDVSRSGLQVIAMMIRLCGAKLLPHLDDLIGSIFGALDSFHGYPNLVEELFEVLRMVVTESSRSPELLSIENDPRSTTKERKTAHVSELDDILSDLRIRKERQSRSENEHELITSAPRRPWSSTEDNPTILEQVDDAANGEDDEHDQPLEHVNKKETDLSRSHRLLLNIAQSTVPHMSSPSPKVRLTLLELLQEICPLLDGHENSFLPLVNSIWPAIIARLFNSNEGVVADAAYNVKAAAVTITAICRAAGGFMSSRIEETFSELEGLFKERYSSVVRPAKGKKLVGPLDGKLSTAEGSTVNSVAKTSTELVANEVGSTLASAHHDTTRTSEGQILEALVDLMMTILQHVRISEDNADKVFDLLGPLMHRKSIQETLLAYNADAAWLMERRSR
ncbi:hypothetical protein H2200_002247 [Cladophialophora chaetospira]|uniref:HEAT repeat protein n=1 Tax=Cladophialophora chaetospira TaxID=386627 RepID=A0AA38XJF4_9EURO|nr:hypothetical protein H2200_002247 [Cladophialophora chaetospira]